MCFAGTGGLVVAVKSCLILSVPYVVLFLVAGGGAGDAKMMGAIGTWLTVDESLTVLVCVAVIGGLIALLKMIMMRELVSRMRKLYADLYVLSALFRIDPKLCISDELKREPSEKSEVTRHGIPYGVAIFLGVTLAAVITELGWLP